MKKKNYKVSWLRKQKRKERKLNICQSICKEVSNLNQRSPTVEEFLMRSLAIRIMLQKSINIISLNIIPICIYM